MITRTLHRFALLFLCGFVAAGYSGPQQLNQNMQGPAKLHPQFYERAYRLFDAPATPAPATQ